MDYNRIIMNRAALLTLVLNLMSATPLSFAPCPWLNPCGGSNPTNTDMLNQFNQSDLQIDLKIIARKCEAIQQKNTRLSDVIVTTRIEDEEEAKQLRLLPALTGFPNTHIIFTPGMTIEQTIVVYYNRLSIASVFLEQAESEFSPYRDDIMGVQRSVVQMLCQLCSTMTHQQQHLQSSVSRDVMPESYRTLPNTASQDIRNFLIARDIVILIESMKIDIGRFLK